MDYKTVLVHVGPDSATPPRLRLTGKLADWFGAAVIGLTSEAPDPWIDAATPYLDAAGREALWREAADRLAKSKAAFDEMAALVEGPATWRAETRLPALALADASAEADLVVIGQAGAAALIPEILPRPGDVIMSAGAPVLVAHPDCDTLIAETVIIGWKNSRETRRAVSDALPFLKAAKRVILASVAERGAPVAAGDAGAVIKRLARHGILAETRTCAEEPEGAGASLIALGRTVGSDLICAGAYGHDRAREWVFGGVTQHLLTHAGHCVLLSR